MKKLLPENEKSTLCEAQYSDRYMDGDPDFEEAVDKPRNEFYINLIKSDVVCVNGRCSMSVLER